MTAKQLAEVGLVAEAQMKGDVRHTEGVVGEKLACLVQPQAEPVLLWGKPHARPEGAVEGGFAHAAQLRQLRNAQAAGKIPADVLQRRLQGPKPFFGKDGALPKQVDQLIELGLQKQGRTVNVPVQAGELPQKQFALPGQPGGGNDEGELAQPGRLPVHLLREKLDAQVGNDFGPMGLVEVRMSGIIYLQGKTAAPGRVENVPLLRMKDGAAVQIQGKGTPAFLRQKE